MGCGVSKVDDLPLVTLCRERRDYIKTASDTRYALAAAHLTYFQSLKRIGDALCKFVDEDLVIGGAGGSYSLPDSPVLTLPSDEGKPGKGKPQGKSSSSSSISLSHSFEDVEDSHLHLSDSDSDLDSGHVHIESSPEPEVPSSSYNQPPNFVYSPNSSGAVYPPNSSGYGYDPTSSGYGYDPTSSFGNYPNSNMYYMRRSETPAQTFYYGEPERFPVQNGPSSDSYSGYGGGGFFGFSMGSPAAREDPYNAQPGPQKPGPPREPPSPPKASSSWDFFNVFDGYDNGGYLSYFPGSRYGNGSSAASSPDSKEVREREGIPDLEDETEQEQEVLKEVRKEKKKANEDSAFRRNHDAGEGTSRHRNLQQNSGEGTSRGVPKQTSSEGSSGTVHLHSSESSLHSVHEKEIKSSPDIDMSKSPEEEHVKKKRVSFEFEEASTMDVGSSKGSSLTTLSVHGTRDVQEVVKEIRDEFETASSYGKEVAMLLEVGKLPYQSRVAALKVIFSRILCLVAPSTLASHPPSKPSIRMSSKMIKMAKGYHGEPGKDFNLKSGNLSSTLEKLHAWEKKLYKEVKDEEKLRVVYEKECKRLKRLDDHGAESAKIDAAQASVRKLLTKINVCIRAVDTISSRIHKLRDEELLPQVTELIHGLIRMWKSMLKCHQKQFQAIMESRIRSLKGNAGLRKDSGLKATLELEMELLSWCSNFNNWVNTQKSYVQSLNGWLLRCINSEPEETADGVAPFSPSRIGAPPIFVICNDWFQAMEIISQQAVADAMYDFASTLHQLWDRQDEAQRQRVKAENLSKDLENRLKKLGMERMRREHGHAASSDKSARSKTTSESGVSALDDLKVDLDSMRKRFSEEKARHKEAIKMVNSAASNSLQTGLIPIFEALGSFTSEALKVHEQVRVQNVGGS
ncbi:hypothetical protein RchiOBHm_Chr6g0296121 [Rosa chinensis]|uniref:DUF632 domain-containing protein n=1 Tax=Rosa chinensis TaxID=74649 RepID=A0A2P6PXB4_ROSCH|nr:protein ROLLING AND ERECT LEAF 2 [Rosa chinensis]XP_024165609.1 protein ROLLING AND ERECT LEAF 2 [Rosa chinensis]XP_040364925.1 protein ROLLING AND ERECT LEAF 2 [Rosa chinensis]PRQ26578.1 hypothetical protein RchiOBHm_Chr6g0296121 [Rosa chinensis]